MAAGGTVRAINAKAAAGKFSNTALKNGELPKLAELYKAKGLAWLKYEGDKFTGPIEKFFAEPVKQSLKERLGIANGDLLLFVADQEPVVCEALGAIRSHLGSALGLYKNWWDEKKAWDAAEEGAGKKEKRRARPFVLRPEHLNLLWVVEFPSFIWDEEEKRWVALHHPFTSPRDEDLPNLESDPGKVKAKAYDLVMNGYEVGGGSIRIHSPEVQSRVFKMLGMSEEDARSRFGFLLDALEIRRAAARRHRLRDRPLGHDLGRHDEHPRRDCVPQERESPRHDDRSTGGSRRPATARFGVEIGGWRKLGCRGANGI